MLNYIKNADTTKISYSSWNVCFNNGNGCDSNACFNPTL